MGRVKKSWREKLADSKDLPKIIKPKGKNAAQYGDRMVVPAPIDVDAEMKKIRKGKVATVGDVRKKLALKQNVDSACPLCCGIFVWISAHAAQESEDECKKSKKGKKRITPWWRTVKAKGELNPKYPGGMKEQARRLRNEGHVIEKRGKR